MQGRHFEMTMARAYVYNKVRSLLAVFVTFEVLNHEDKKRGRGKGKIFVQVPTLLCIQLLFWKNSRSKTRRNIKTWCEWVIPFSNECWATSNSILITLKQVLGGNKVISPKERLAVTISHTQNCLALLPSFHPWWPRLRLLNCASACSTTLKERGKWLQLRFNIPNILENKRNVEWMLKRSLEALILISFNIGSRSFQHVSTMLKGGGKRFQHCHLTKSKGCRSRLLGPLRPLRNRTIVVPQFP